MFYFRLPVRQAGADRANRLEIGEVIALSTIHNQFQRSFFPTFCPYFKDDFLLHLKKLLEPKLPPHSNAISGISNPQIIYLDNPQKLSITQFFLELLFEYVRFLRYSAYPSRFKSLFATTDKANAIKLIQQSPNNGQIFKVQASGNIFIGDVNWLSQNAADSDIQIHNADSYWQGLPCSEDNSYTPFWECLLEQVKIINKVDI